MNLADTQRLLDLSRYVWGVEAPRAVLRIGGTRARMTIRLAESPIHFALSAALTGGYMLSVCRTEYDPRTGAQSVYERCTPICHTVAEACDAAEALLRGMP